MAPTVLLCVLAAMGMSFDVVDATVKVPAFELVNRVEPPVPTYAVAYAQSLNDGRPMLVAVGQSEELERQLQALACATGHHFAVADVADGFAAGVHRLVVHDGRLYFDSANPRPPIADDRRQPTTPRCSNGRCYR